MAPSFRLSDASLPCACRTARPRISLCRTGCRVLSGSEGCASSDHIRASVAFTSMGWRLSKLFAEALNGLPNGLVPLAESVEHEAGLRDHFPSQHACLIEGGA